MRIWQQHWEMACKLEKGAHYGYSQEPQNDWPPRMSQYQLYPVPQ